MALAVEDIWNQAFRAGGVPLRVNEAFEGSDGSRVALEIYSQCRDELLRNKDWSFNRKVASLTMLKGPPPNGGFNAFQPYSNIYAYPGFLFEYAYPADALDIRAIIEPPSSMPDLDPLPALLRVDNDPTPIVSGNPPVASGPPQKVLLCNVYNAVCVYRAQITTPALWNAGFIEALVAELGERFRKAFGTEPNQEQIDAAKAASARETSAAVRG